MSRRTSVSRLTSIARCGTAFELERIERLPALPAGWTIQGIGVHDAADGWEKSGRTMTVQAAQEIFKTTWREEIAKADQRFPDRDRWLVGGRKKVQNDLIDRYEGGQQQIADYIRYNLEDDQWRPYTMPDGTVAAEVGFEVEFAGVIVRGYIDLLMEHIETGELRVRDIKTGSKIPDVPFQLIVYAMAVNDVIGAQVEWGEYFMTRDGKPTVPIDLTKLDHEWIRTWFLRQVQIEEQRLFLPNSGDACRTCGVIIHCPLKK
ncbi:PD-(D/E)XK nuclease superfamily protein [Streptosporangium canum]|uniref:PD-(D/E)XK nuclease superfamily protein n=1 Tax=Streptosporangium canum TaxID=324952 RepID=A0A1I3L3V0_9ACTN|nr:PD-(D/E)XK nuclease family protein [Streptosporangium canum]SFI79413.1 PD-(D/E)XK nuclease superfamily protein [Streptosporangium canum]